MLDIFDQDDNQKISDFNVFEDKSIFSKIKLPLLENRTKDKSNCASYIQKPDDERSKSGFVGLYNQ